jgi:hypothetical protein
MGKKEHLPLNWDMFTHHLSRMHTPKIFRTLRLNEDLLVTCLNHHLLRQEIDMLAGTKQKSKCNIFSNQGKE